MKIITRALYWLIHNPWLFLDNIVCRIPNLFSDALFLKIRFRCMVGYPLNLNEPKSFNEKLQWLKLNDVHEEYTKYVDKIEAKEIAKKILGDDFIIPTLGIWNKVDDIDWRSLPNQFVIKPTGDSGSVIVCKDKKKLDIVSAKKKLSELGSRDYTRITKEYPYKYVPHRYIAEEYIVDDSGVELKDYKFFCFNGKVKFLFVATGRQNNDLRFDFFDRDFNHLPFFNSHKNADVCPVCPRNFELMITVAEKLSSGFPHVRVDLYNVNGKVLFGEFTFFHNTGLYPFEPRDWDYKFGEYLHLPQK